MNLLFPFLQFGNAPAALAEWFIASVVLVAIVTLIYVSVLARSPPPEGATVAKLEKEQGRAVESLDPHPYVLEADQALKSNNLGAAVESSAKAISISLTGVLSNQFGSSAPTMGISDAAYLVQTKARNAPQIAQPVYQLNTLRLQALQGQPISGEQASWAVSLARWIVQAVDSGQIVV